MKIEEVIRTEVNCEQQEIDILNKCIEFLNNLLKEMSNRKFEWAFCESESEGDSRDFSPVEIVDIINKLELLQYLQEFYQKGVDKRK